MCPPCTGNAVYCKVHLPGCTIHTQSHANLLSLASYPCFQPGAQTRAWVCRVLSEHASTPVAWVHSGSCIWALEVLCVAQHLFFAQECHCCTAWGHTNSTESLCSWLLLVVQGCRLVCMRCTPCAEASSLCFAGSWCTRCRACTAVVRLESDPRFLDSVHGVKCLP
jgi:hypothetical protein